MKTKKGFILYFDILGYKNIVTNKKLEYILDLYSEKQGELNFALVFNKNYIKNKDKLLMRCFSDNFLFLYEHRPFCECNTEKMKINYCTTLNGMMGMASIIQSQFLEQGILTRGSLSYGELSYNSKIVYGKDLIEAVLLEEGHNEPSIVLSEKFKNINHKPFEYTKCVCPFMYRKESREDYTKVISGVKKYLKNLEIKKISGDEKDKILFKIQWMIESICAYFDFNKTVEIYEKDEKFILREKH